MCCPSVSSLVHSKCTNWGNMKRAQHTKVAEIEETLWDCLPLLGSNSKADTSTLGYLKVRHLVQNAL